MNFFKLHTNPQTLHGYDNPCVMATDQYVNGNRNVDIVYMVRGEQHRVDGPSGISVGLVDTEVAFGSLYWALDGMVYANGITEDDQILFDLDFGHNAARIWPFKSPKPRDGDVIDYEYLMRQAGLDADNPPPFHYHAD